MDKKDLKKIAMLGIASGVIFSVSKADAAGYRYGNQDYFAGRNGCGGGNGCGGHDDDDGGNNGNGNGNGNGKDMKNDKDNAYLKPDGKLKEKELISQLSEESKAIYQSLDEQEKQLVLRMATQFQDKNDALKQEEEKAEKEKEQAARPKRSVLRHSLL